MDTAVRVIPHSGRNFYSGTPAYKIDQCALLTASRGYNTFGVQYTGQCYTGPDARRTYNKYGSGVGCRNGLGGAFRNSVYFLGKLVVRPTREGRGRRWWRGLMWHKYGNGGGCHNELGGALRNSVYFLGK